MRAKGIQIVGNTTNELSESNYLPAIKSCPVPVRSALCPVAEGLDMVDEHAATR
jgi:hypothetical protein